MKKNSRLVKAILFGVVALSLLGMLLVPSFQEKTAASENGRTEYLARISKGVSGVGFASSVTEVPLAVNSMDSYIEERSGLRLNASVSDKLVSLEENALTNNKALVSFDKLVDVITNVGLKRLSELNDRDLMQVIESTTFQAPDLPEKVKQQPLIAIRPGYYAAIEKEKGVEKLKTLQSPKVQSVAKSYIRSFIGKELKNSLVNLAAASPEKFGRNWDFSTNSPAKALTPAQAYLLSYSLVSGDLLVDDREGIEKTKRSIYANQVKMLGHYPNPNNYLAYGSNGYLYSSPVDIFFNQKVQLKLLEELAK